MKENHSTTLTGKPFYYVMTFSIFWALQIFVTKLGFNAGARVLSFQSISLLTTLLVLAFLVLPKYWFEFRDLFKKTPLLFWKLFFANGIQSGLGTGLSLIGISLTEAINASFLIKLATVTTILFAWLILKEQLTVIKILMVLSMLTGAYLLTTKGQVIVPRIGDLFILSACVCWSLGNVLVRKFLQTQSINIEALTFQKPIAGLPVILAFVAVSVWNPRFVMDNLPIISWHKPTLASLPYAMGSGICLALAWTYLNRTLKITSASYMTMMSMVTPVIVSVLAMVFLNESMNWVQFVGAGAIILSGVVTYFSGIAQA